VILDTDRHAPKLCLSDFEVHIILCMCNQSGLCTSERSLEPQARERTSMREQQQLLRAQQCLLPPCASCSWPGLARLHLQRTMSRLLPTVEHKPCPLGRCLGLRLCDGTSTPWPQPRLPRARHDASSAVLEWQRARVTQSLTRAAVAAADQRAFPEPL